MAAESKKQESPGNEMRLLSAAEREFCSQIAATESPYSARAVALLAVDNGETQAEAGRQSGLTYGQVHYWLGKFRKEGITIFPEELVIEVEPDVAAPAASQEPLPVADEQEAQEGVDAEETAVAGAEAVEPEDGPKAKKKKKKSKKSKKTKKSKKSKKAKKPKKLEKEKKPVAKKKGKKGTKSDKKKSKKKKDSKGKKGKKKNKK